MRKKFLIYSSSSVLILAAIAIVVNVISSYVNLRLDFTAGGIYSLSQSSKKILRSLPDRVIIKAYFTKDLPQEYGSNRNYVEDLFAEYGAYSRGKVSYSFIDPLATKNGAREAGLAGIPAVQFTQIRRDKYEVKEAYMGIVFIYGDKKEVIPVVRAVEGLEYDITGRIKKLLFPEIKTIGITTGSGENADLSAAADVIAERYKTELLDLHKSTFVPEGISALLVIGPKKSFSEKALLAVDQMIMKGVPVALLLDEFFANTQAFYSYKIDNGFKDFADFYGIKILPGFVLDPQCERISVRQSQGNYAIENVIEYPFFPRVTDLNRSNAITRALDSIGLIFISPIEMTKKPGFNYEILMRSSRKSQFFESPRNLNPFQDYKQMVLQKKGPLDLAVVVTPDAGKTQVSYPSFFTGRNEKMFRNIISETKKPGRLFIMGNSSFVLRETAFFMNLLDWLSQDEDLISIRSKGSAYRPLKPVSDAAKGFIKYSAIFFVPALIAAYGIFRWNLRKKLKKQYKDLYA